MKLSVCNLIHSVKYEENHDTYAELILMSFSFQRRAMHAPTSSITREPPKKAHDDLHSADSHVPYGELTTGRNEVQDGTMVDVYEWDTGKFSAQLNRLLPHTRWLATSISTAGHWRDTYGAAASFTILTGLSIRSLIYLTLQRAKNARELFYNSYPHRKIRLLQLSESFSISDPMRLDHGNHRQRSREKGNGLRCPQNP
jgi:hypothetical protein